MASTSEDEEDAEMSLKERLLGLVARVIGRNKSSVDIDGCSSHSPSKYKLFFLTFHILLSCAFYHLYKSFYLAAPVITQHVFGY